VLERHPGVEVARLYGSRAKGNYRPGSDIDLTLLGSGLTSGDLLKIEIEVEALGLPYQVDLSLYDQIEDPALRDHIERIGLIFFEARPRVQGP
jgi:predicted nucleotidyltransferase